ncbi:MAG: DUF4832 domain-containing protein [Bacteroidetes bacterium]|nr:DUF4832 domain-containing protein [Bacteroidota bacterium]
MNRLLILLILVFFQALACSIRSFSQIKSGSLVVRPKEIDDVLTNPGIGFTTFQRFNGDTLTTLNNKSGWTEGRPIVYQTFKGDLINKQYPQSSIAYWRVYWKYLEPEKGKYRWDLIDQALATARERGQTLLLRVAPYGSLQPDGSNEEIKNNDVPKWYRQMVGEKTNWKYNNPVNKWLVNAEDPRYVQYFGRFIKELGKRYDGNPDLEAVDLSIVGAWGEGAGSFMLLQKTREALINAYTDNFKKTPLIALLTDEKTNRYINDKVNAGWRVDCIGDLGFWAKDQNGWTHMYDYYPESIIKFGVMDAWKKAPISLEICGTFYWWKDLEGYTEKDVKYIFDQTLKWHISSFNAKSSPVPPEWEPLVNDWLKKMGYRFVLRKFSCPETVKRNSKLSFQTWWENKGVAPCYKNFLLAIRLKSNEDSIISLTAADIRKWLPGDNIYDSSIYIPKNIPQGYYELQIGIVDPITRKPRVQLAIEGKDAEGWYDLGKIKID